MQKFKMFLEKSMQSGSYLVHFIVTSILTQKSSPFDMKWESYGLLKFEFFKNRREREFDVELIIWNQDSKIPSGDVASNEH